jgi:CO/xanthine dehydrogenase FAD-binding subunit
VLGKFRLRNTIDFPIVSVASVITIGNGTCRDAKIALEAVTQRTIRPTKAERPIKGRAANSSTAEAAAEVAIRREVERCEVEFHKIIGDMTENPILIFFAGFYW